MPDSDDLVIIFQTPYESKKNEVLNLFQDAGIEVTVSESSTISESSTMSEAPAMKGNPGEIKARLLIKLSDIEKAEQILWKKGFL